jgi:NAD+ kinase
MINKLHFVIDKTLKDKSLKISLIKKFGSFSLSQSSVIVVVGGDGFMLEILKKYYKLNKPFYGVNKGTFGFLMNKFELNKLHRKINRAKLIKVSPLLMNVITKRNVKKKGIAVNEISLLRQSRQTASLKIICGKKILIKKLISDGILISTPAGSTAYNLSVHGPILNLNSKKISIAPISAFRPRRWKGKIVSDKSKITITNLNPTKRPISAVADNIEVRNAKKIIIKVQNKLKFNLLYDTSSSLQKKIKLEQLRRETN